MPKILTEDQIAAALSNANAIIGVSEELENLAHEKSRLTGTSTTIANGVDVQRREPYRVDDLDREPNVLKPVGRPQALRQHMRHAYNRQVSARTQDPRFAEALRDSLAAQLPSVEIGWNKPYSAMSGVTYTMEHHGDERGLPTAMIEIRNNEILIPEGIELWAQRLAKALAAARQAIQSPMHHEAAGAPNHR